MLFEKGIPGGMGWKKIHRIQKIKPNEIKYSFLDERLKIRFYLVENKGSKCLPKYKDSLKLIFTEGNGSTSTDSYPVNL